MLLPETDATDALIVAEHVRSAIAASRPPRLPHVTISLGVSTHQRGDLDGARMIGEADHALYQAKQAGRNRVVFSGERARVQRIALLMYTLARSRDDRPGLSGCTRGRWFRGLAAQGVLRNPAGCIFTGGIDKVIGKLGQTRKLLMGILLIPMLLLVGCGAEPTVTSVPAAAPTTAATDTTAPAAATNTTAPAAAPTRGNGYRARRHRHRGHGGHHAHRSGRRRRERPADPRAHPCLRVGARKIRQAPSPPPASWSRRGKLTVGSDASYPPQEYVDAGGKPVGMDIDIAGETRQPHGPATERHQLQVRRYYPGA